MSMYSKLGKSEKASIYSGMPFRADYLPSCDMVAYNLALDGSGGFIHSHTDIFLPGKKRAQTKQWWRWVDNAELESLKHLFAEFLRP